MNSLKRVKSRLAALVALSMVLFGACSDDKPSTSSTTTTTGATATPTTAFVVHGYVDQGDYVNGRHIALVTGVDTAKRTITIDVEQFLTGDAAIKAYKEDGGDQESPDNDYYIRNQSKQLRTFPVAVQPTIRLQSLGSENGPVPTSPDKGQAVTFADFAGYFSGDTAGAARATLFWVTLENGEAKRIEEQFVP